MVNFDTKLDGQYLSKDAYHIYVDPATYTALVFPTGLKGTVKSTEYDVVGFKADATDANYHYATTTLPETFDLTATDTTAYKAAKFAYEEATSEGAVARGVAIPSSWNLSADQTHLLFDAYVFRNSNDVRAASLIVTLAAEPEPPAPTEVTVTFNANGGTGTMAAQSIPANTVTALTENGFTFSGHDFTGWNTQADGQGTPYADKASVTLSEDLTLYAQWEKATPEPVSFTVNFDTKLDGQYLSKDAYHIYVDPATYTALVFPTGLKGTVKSTEYDVVGFKADATDANYHYATTTLPETFDLTATDTTAYKAAKFAYEEATSEGAVARGVAIPSSWNLSADQTHLLFDAYVFRNSNDVRAASLIVTLAAEPEPPAPTEVTVTFNANGGTGTMAAQSIPANTVTALTENGFTFSGHDFTGWNTQADGQGTPYADKASVTLSEDLTLYAQWEKATPVDKAALQSAIADAETLNPDDYYTTGDKFSGLKDSAGNYIISETGFWAEFQSALTAARAVNENADADAVQVESARTALQTAQERIISKQYLNVTPLYEAIYPDRVPHYTYSNWEGKHIGGGLYESEITELSYAAYTGALAESQQFFASLYDEEGHPTSANQGNDDTLATLAAIVQRVKDAAEGLTSKVAYESWYASYRDNLNASILLLSVVEKKLSETGLESKYTSASLAELRACYAALEADVNYHIEGGTFEDLVVLTKLIVNANEAVGASDYDKLNASYRGLVSATDIQIDFCYFNRKNLNTTSTTMIFENGVLRSVGSTTVGALMDQYAIYPVTQGTSKDAVLVYINNECFNDVDYRSIQLHDKDSVTIVITYTPKIQRESSTGTTSSQWGEYDAASTTNYADSLSIVTIGLPDSITVGQSTAFSASVTGAYLTNLNQAGNAQGITLYISEAYDAELATGASIPQPRNAVGTVGADGKVSYVFTKQGWYVVALIAAQTDVPTAFDIYQEETHGTYYSLYAPAVAVVYINGSADEAALMAEYRQINLAKAKELYVRYSENDFEGTDYAAFKETYDMLVYAMNSEEITTYDDLMAEFNDGYALMEQWAAKAVNHDERIADLRAEVALIPEDLAELNYTHKFIVTRIRSKYDALNDYQKSLLTPLETQRIEEILAYVAEHAAQMEKKQTVYVTVQESGIPWSTTSGFYTSAPLHNKVFEVKADGTKVEKYYTYGTMGTRPASDPMEAYPGYEIEIRRMLTQTDELYWMQYSVDGGETWRMPESSADDADFPVVRNDHIYCVNYVIPFYFTGSALDIKLKTISKAEYDALTNADVEETRASALAALDAAYDAYDLSKYDAEGQAALAQALADGKAAVNAATTNDAVAAARKAAVAAMAAVPTAGSGSGSQTIGSFDKGRTVGRVHVIIENTTYKDSPFYDTIADGNYALGENDSMMSMVLGVLEDKGFTWNGTGGESGATYAAEGYAITYLGSIEKDGVSLGEFDGNPKSGWMGTLNDWFVNESFASFSVANGKLENGDEIHVMFTMALGADIGSVWGVNDTTLDTLTVTGAKLSPAFDGSTTEYTLIVPASGATVTVYPIPVNKNYQSRVFLNDYNKDSAQYKRTDLIAVKPGDVIYVGVGEKGWPTMNNGGKPMKYTLTVTTEDGAVDGLDPSKVKQNNYSDYAAILATIDRSALSEAGKAKYDAVQEKITFYTQIDDVKAKLAALPKSGSASDDDVKAAKSAIEAADSAYKALSEDQQLYITVNDVSNYNKLVERLVKLTPEEEQQDLPKPIEGSEQAPEGGSSSSKTDDTTDTEIEAAEVTVKTEVTDGEAKAEVSAENITEALKDAEDADTLTVKVDTTDADKVEATLDADAVKAAADADVDLHVETEVGTIKVDSGTLTELAEAGKDIAVTVTANEDGTTTLDVTADGESVDAKVKVELPATDEGQVLVIVNEDGIETVVKKSLVEDGKAYAELPAGATVKVVEVEGTEFGDVADSAWYADAVEFVASHELFQGTNNGFEPETTMNRAMLAMVLYRLEDATATGNSEFPDVSDDAWYAEAVAWASETGIVNGTGKGFAPNAPVTREQIATMLYRYANVIGLNTGARGELGSFPDGGDTSGWAQDAMAWAVSVGLFQGDDTGALNPKGDATRAEVAALTERLIKLIVK